MSAHTACELPISVVVVLNRLLVLPPKNLKIHHFLCRKRFSAGKSFQTEWVYKRKYKSFYDLRFVSDQV